MSGEDRVRWIPAVGPLRHLRRVILSRSSGTPEYFARVQRKRSNPAATDPGWLLFRERNRIFGSWFSQWSPAQATVLDVGGGIQPYRRLITSEHLHYIGLDIFPTPLVDVVADAVRLPFREESIDAIICTAVLQLTEDPKQAVSEMHRVLKPGGVAFLGISAVSPIVAPQDRWRFSPNGIRVLASQFSDVEIVAEAGGISTVLVLSLILLSRNRVWRIVSKPFILLFNLMALGLEKIVGRGSVISSSYAVRARK
jgi:SAM-dependent methyltransferase